ncbi:DoxX family protein [Aureisphaera galaxeae]|uniref:DoxX family protein n=1 Tax=Aureisphaera galaxeae TaxID=1538023 RepID=UPI0023500456|nr:DoxX family protein [Aureisphaera galaxeae]MDC8003934.1 DoxX family protein [Aureisphaera galaxeae]
MKTPSKLDQIHFKTRQNRWLWYFSIFCRLALAAGFIPAGLTKIMGERFASGLSVSHPMGQYLEALHHTGYYYTSIGIAQVLAAILLLIPRTVTLGALLYLPIILNICILSYTVRFDGSFVSAPLMLLANLYILFWNYDRIRFILPLKVSTEYTLVPKPDKYSNKFPFLFFTGAMASMGMIILFFIYGHEVMPRNSLSECKKQFVGTENEAVGSTFCECIHTHAGNLDECLTVYEKNKK